MSIGYGPRVVTDGLVLALDAADTNSYKTDNNLLDPSTWYVGATSVTGFGFNGAADENALIEDTDPFGNTAVIWKAYSPGGLGDGGWNSDYIDVDHTKLYRFSVWVNRKVTGTDGNFYFGTRGYDDSLSNVGVLYRSSGTNDTNPYFYFTYQPPTEEQLPEDQWVLVVAHVWPSGSGTGSDKPETGVYNTDGTKRTITTGPTYIPKDFVWNTTVTKTAHRTYLYYSENDASVIQHWAYPRIDLVDGTEPSIDDLINNRVNSLYWYDICGQNNNGTLLNGVSHTSGADGYFNFNGTNDYVSASLNNPGGDWIHSIEFWMYMNQNQSAISSRQDPFQIGTNTTSRYSAVDISNNNFNWYFYSNDCIVTTNLFVANTWYYIGLTYTGGGATSTNKKLYVNGVNVPFNTSGSANLNIPANSTLSIGRDGARATAYFNGRISNFKIYNRALTASEIQQNYIALRGRFGI